jgi:hypothetical protein
VDQEKTEDVDLAMSGTILTQDTSLEFARMSSAKLATRVLRGYSELASHIEEFIESRVTQANTARQDFLRRFGMPASITKLDTAYDRIVKHEVDRLLPAYPHGLEAWLEAMRKSQTELASDLPERWRAWGSDAVRNELARQIARTAGNIEQGQRTIRDWLQQYNNLNVQTGEYLKTLEARIGPIRGELDQMVSEIATWGDWLERRVPPPQTGASTEATTLTNRIRELQAKQQQVILSGRTARAQLDHLVQAEAFVRETWSKQYPNDCPTCGANHAEHGGILRVIDSLRTKATEERDKLLQEYNVLREAIEQAQRQLVELGYSQCPVSVESQTHITAALQWLLLPGQDFSECVGNRLHREELLRAIATARQAPSPPAPVNVESESLRFVSAVQLQLREADRTFEAPNDWKPVQSKLTETLAGIVNKHLPDTLARLWCELAMNLTTAPWVLPDRPSIGVITRRGEQKSMVLVKDRLARYIFNQSEIHILGLAWFFTRYLTRGRFFHAVMIMDDPAQELDQTSFRDLCRLWETWLRLHCVYNRPLKLVLMLNQESRAVEAARATGGILTVLGWTQEQDQSLSAINVIGDGFYPPQPARLFAETAN